jgi:uncharacterized protein (DUF433 family)
MNLDDYFDFLAADDIRLKGHRIGIETILFDYQDGLTPEEIALRYPTLSLEEVYATITYYWRNQEQVETYLKAIADQETHLRAEQERNLPPAVKRMRELVKARQTALIE